MKLPIAALLTLAVAGCSQGPVEKPAVQRSSEPVKLSREQILRNREALAMTSAYRRKVGITTETVKPMDARDGDPLTRIRLAKTHPEYGTTAPMIQGVDYVTPAQTGTK